MLKLFYFRKKYREKNRVILEMVLVEIIMKGIRLTKKMKGV